MVILHFEAELMIPVYSHEEVGIFLQVAGITNHIVAVTKK